MLEKYLISEDAELADATPARAALADRSGGGALAARVLGLGPPAGAALRSFDAEADRRPGPLPRGSCSREWIC
jgi:hypothetical protein